MVIVKTKKYVQLANAIAVCHDSKHYIYSLVNGQGRQIKNLLVHLVLCMLSLLSLHDSSLRADTEEWA